MSSDHRDLNGLPLFDHHCHTISGRPLERDEFESLISESTAPPPAGATNFDSPVGFAIRRHCAPALGLEPFASPEEYLEERARLGVEAANRRLMRAADIRLLGIETGIHAPGALDAAATAEAAGADHREILRLERLAETVAADMRERGEPAAELLARFGAALDAGLRTAIGVKTIAAYRIGLDFEPARPSPEEVEATAARWFAGTGRHEFRLAEPTIIRALIWAAVDRGCMIQVHVGYGDDDLDLDRCDPLRLTSLLRATAATGARFALLHCYPFHREAGYLAHVFPHVWFDVGLAIHYSGARSPAVIAESLELAPFRKILFSTDAYALPEFYLLGALLFRRGLAAVLRGFREHDGWPAEECRRIALDLGYRNGLRAYGLDEKALRS
ncbi:amidohydrolase family protein [Gulosibacter sp. 10]|uniref:amidohydrolase family protein n=1 Tax=Gulosibacter sp. 10 TaxID=1255570 RepID=UPI00097F553A|nr:amidohydrolase family protein [Gulosibacter sp. 10]SJM60344.1 nodulin / glutamate-ammonia ligase-like protein [Gulosibacter sp. 10]